MKTAFCIPVSAQNSPQLQHQKLRDLRIIFLTAPASSRIVKCRLNVLQIFKGKSRRSAYNILYLIPVNQVFRILRAFLHQNIPVPASAKIQKIFHMRRGISFAASRKLLRILQNSVAVRLCKLLQK